MIQNETLMTPQQHAQYIAQLLEQAKQKCRADVILVNDPKAQALFETLAEVLTGAQKALHDYIEGRERAWQPSSSTVTPSTTQHTEPPLVTDMAVDISEDEPPPLYTEVPKQ